MLIFLFVLIIVVGVFALLAWVARERDERKREYEKRVAEEPYAYYN